MGDARVPGRRRRPTPDDLDRIDESPVRCFDPDGRGGDDRRDRGRGEGRRLARRRSSRCSGYGVPPGLGSHVHWDRRIDGLLAQALMSIQAMKARRDRRRLRRSRAGGGATPTTRSCGTPSDRLRARGSDRGGGTEGGMTTGALLVAARRDEAARDAEPAGAADRRRRDQGGDGLVQGADRRHRGPGGRRRRRDDGRARARRRRRCASSAATRSPSSCATTTPTSRLVRAAEPDRRERRCGERSRPQPERPPRARRADGRGQDDGRPPLRGAARAGRFVDTDELVEASSGQTVAELFATVGEVGFRAVERQAVADACASPTPVVIACGGGAVLDADNRRRLQAIGLRGVAPRADRRCSPLAIGVDVGPAAARRTATPRSRSSGSPPCATSAYAAVAARRRSTPPTRSVDDGRRRGARRVPRARR